jgi:hypothetical protein
MELLKSLNYVVRAKLMNMRDEYFSLVESHQLRFIYYVSTCPKHYYGIVSRLFHGPIIISNI